MGLPILCAENLLSDLQFPDFTISASEEATDHEVWRLANGRRSASDYWASISTGTVAWARAVFDAPRDVNFVAIDRGHNLAGKTVQVWTTDAATDFSSGYNVDVSATMPSASAAGDIDSTNGIVTEDGSWVKRFTTRTDMDAVQLVIPQVTDWVPNIVGCWLGYAIELARPFDLPWDEDAFEIVVDETESDAGWFGRGPITRRRRGEMGIRFTSDAEYEAARLQLRKFGMGIPTWLVYDDTAAERAVLATHRGRMGATYTEGWPNKRRTLLEWIEWEPLP